jgi:hypothetical protein
MYHVHGSFMQLHARRFRGHAWPRRSDADNLVAYLKALGGSTLVKRLGTEAFDDILFGTSRYPSEMVDLGDLDI